MQYQVRFVEDVELPGEVEFVFVRLADVTYLFVKWTAIDLDTGRCDALTRAWQVWEAAEVAAVHRGLRSFARAV